jgi:hypothetical protein
MPILAQCRAFESAPGNDDTAAGTARHSALREYLLKNPAWQKGLSEEDMEAVTWAGDIIQTMAPTSDYPLRTEYHVNPLGDDFKPLFDNGGTLDVCCGPYLFDLKTRERDYLAQMAAYALGMIQEDGWPEVRVRLLFTEGKRVERYDLTEAHCWDILRPIINAPVVPKPCDYCGWCAKAATCPAVTQAVATVAKGYSDIDKVKSWHPSAMETGEEIGLALWLWRTVLKKWGESVEFHALEAAQKKGLTIPGFDLKTKAGKTYVTDVPAAFSLAGLPQEEFLAGCQVRMNTSKKYPDQKGIIDIFAAFHGLKKAPAKRDLLAKLEAVVKQTNPSIYLQAQKGQEDTETDE